MFKRLIQPPPNTQNRSGGRYPSKKGVARKLLFAILIVMVVIFGGIVQQVGAEPPDEKIPPDFNLLAEDIGVRLFRKDYQQGTPDFVQILNSHQGATIKLLHGEIVAPREGRGQYGGADPRFNYQSLTQFWRQATTIDDKTFCLLNGQFFYMPESPTRLALALKVNGEIITDGFGYNQYAAEDLLMLELWNDHARIRQATSAALQTSSAPNIIGGLSQNANKRSKYSVGRTFIGVDDRDGDWEYETILVFNTTSATQSGAADILHSFGAESVMMLDGGGSTQLYCRDGWHIQSDRLIPQAIAVVAGSEPPYQARLRSQPYWPVIVVGEPQDLIIEFTNTGAKNWETESEELLIQKEPWGSKERLALSAIVEPGQTAAYSWSTSKLRRSGVYEIEVLMTHYRTEFPVERSSFNLVVLPAELAERQGELQDLIDDWAAHTESDIALLARTWLEEEGNVNLPIQSGQLATAGLQFNLRDAILIPIIMLPFVLVLVIVINRIQHRK